MSPLATACPARAFDAPPAPSVRVVLRDLRWAVVPPGSAAPYSSHDRRDDAVREARTLALLRGADLVVYGLDGKPKLDV